VVVTVPLCSVCFVVPEDENAYAVDHEPSVATASAWSKSMGTGCTRRATLSQAIRSANMASNVAPVKPPGS